MTNMSPIDFFKTKNTFRGNLVWNLFQHFPEDRLIIRERTSMYPILNQMEFHLVQNRKENCHHDHIPFNLKGNGNIYISICFQIEWDMIVVSVFLSILNQMEYSFLSVPSCRAVVQRVYEWKSINFYISTVLCKIRLLKNCFVLWNKAPFLPPPRKWSKHWSLKNGRNECGTIKEI